MKKASKSMVILSIAVVLVAVVFASLYNSSVKLFQTNMLTTSVEGEFFWVNFTVVKVSGLAGWQVDLSYDSSLIEYRGAYYPDGHVFNNYQYIPFNNAPSDGVLKVGAVILGAGGFTGDAPVISMKFLYFSEGEYVRVRSMEDTYLVDAQGKSIPFNLQGIW